MRGFGKAVRCVAQVRGRLAASVLLIVLSGATVGHAAKDDTTLVSGPTGVEGPPGNADSMSPALSGDGRFVAFTSSASNLDPDDHDDHGDVYVRDLQGGTTILVSRATGTSGAKGDGVSYGPDISGDGRYVTFASRATNLDADDGDATADVYVRDLVAGSTTLVSRAGGPSGVKGNGASLAPSMSGDGRHVSFESQATNLDPAGDTDVEQDVFVRDLVGRTTALASRATGVLGDGGDGTSMWARISGDGRHVAFESTASNLDPADGDSNSDVFVRDLQAGVTTLVSRAAGVAGAHANGAATLPDISADGRVVTFASSASNLSAADGDSVPDAFVRDLVAYTTRLVSRASSGTKGSGSSFMPRISADGTSVAFWTLSSNLDPADRDEVSDVYVRHMPSGLTTLVSRTMGFAGAKGDGASFSPYISGDGASIAFESVSANLDPNGDTGTDVFVRDLEFGTTPLASRATGTAGLRGRSSNSTLSADGRYVAFESFSSRLDPVDADTLDDVFVRDRAAGSTTLVSRASGADGVKGDGQSYEPAMSQDGSYVVFVSESANLDPTDGDTQRDVFLRDRQSAATTLVSRATGATGVKSDSYSMSPDVSDGGRYVAFMSTATNLDATVPGTGGQIYVRDVQTATTTLVSRASGPAGAAGDGNSTHPAISADGRYVAFWSTATNLDPAGGDTDDVFVRDLEQNTTVLVSRSTSGAKGNSTSRAPAISGDGRYVAFQSVASNLDPDDGDTREDVFVHDLALGTTTLVSRAGGTSGASGANDSYGPSISRDGRYVTFASTGANLDPADGDITSDVFVRDLALATTTLLSRASGTSGAKGNDASFPHALSADGRWASFESLATNLDPADRDPVRDIFVRDVLGPPSAPPPPPPPPTPSPAPAPPPPHPPPPPPPRGVAPKNLSAPAVEGRALTGRRVSCSRGTWTGSEPMRFDVRWLREGAVVAEGASRRIVAADVSRRLACRVTASNGAGSAVAASRARRVRSAFVVIPRAGGVIPREALLGVSPTLVCRGSMALTLLKGKRVLARRAVSLKPRLRARRLECRWTSTFRVPRALVGTARKLKVRERFSGNEYIDPGKRVQSVAVPRS